MLQASRFGLDFNKLLNEKEGTAYSCEARHGTARPGTARHGTARHGTARPGTARRACTSAYTRMRLFAVRMSMHMFMKAGRQVCRRLHLRVP